MLSGSGPSADAMTSPAGAVGRESDMTQNYKTTTESLRVSEIWRYPMRIGSISRVFATRSSKDVMISLRG